jgi:hypothetical protein
MKKPDLDAYLALFARATPDPATTAHHLSAAVTLVQTAIAALRDHEPNNAGRPHVALTALLGALTRMTKEFDRTAAWLATIPSTEGSHRLM